MYPANCYEMLNEAEGENCKMTGRKTEIKYLF